MGMTGTPGFRRNPMLRGSHDDGKNEEMKMYFIIMLLLPFIQWQKEIRQQFLLNPVPTII